MLKKLVIIKGAGDLATGVAHRLFQCGFPVLMLEIPKPTVIRRTVAFAEAVYCKEYTVEGLTSILINSCDEVENAISKNKIPVLIDPKWQSIQKLKPFAVIDAILAKKNLGTSLDDGNIVIGLGPGFTAGRDVHAIVETQRGHYLGKVLYTGTALPNSGVPGDIAGYSTERLLRSPSAGIFKEEKTIGDLVKAGQLIATVDETPLYAPISGVLRGLLHSGLPVTEGFKVGDIDPRNVKEYIYSISDKALSIAGGVLEAILHLHSKEEKDGRKI